MGEHPSYEDSLTQRERAQVLVLRHRALLNRLEPHLGCVVCRGPLTHGVCPTCDPPAARRSPEEPA